MRTLLTAVVILACWAGVTAFGIALVRSWYGI